MKTLKLLLLLFLPIFSNAKPQVHFDYKVYYTPSHKAYVETLLNFVSPTFKFLANEKGNLVSQVEIIQIFKIGDSIVLVDKYIINSPEMIDSTIEDFYDVKRFSLSPGSYSYEIEIRDLNTNEVVVGGQNIEIKNYRESEVDFSTMGFIESAKKTSVKNDFVKNGYLILPYLTNYFPPEIEKIATYFEVYNSKSILGIDKQFMLTYEIEQFQSGNKIKEIFRVKKYSTADVVPVISFLPIDKLPTGDYNLVVTLINENNIKISEERLFFQRRSDIDNPNILSIENLDIANSFTNDIYRDSLPFYLNSLLPISPRSETSVIIAMLDKDTVDLDQIQKYFHAYWVETNRLAPFDTWLMYKKQVLIAEKFYATQIKHGFESDRGRVFLQYGVPNDIQKVEYDGTTVPYQIWHYYRIGQRSNVRFVFYNPDLVTNDYPLLHSTMQGEKKNSNWQEYLNNFTSPDRPNDPRVRPEDKDRVYDSNTGRYFKN